MTVKFTDQDRKLVIQELEKIQQVKIEPIKPSRKLFNEFIFKNYNELDEFFQSVKSFSKLQEQFLNF